MSGGIMISRIMGEMKIFFDNSPNIKSVILGVSGGIDSALIAALIDLYNIRYDKSNIKLIGRSIPIQTNTIEECRRAHKVGHAFCDDFDTVNAAQLNDIHDSFCNLLSREGFDRNETSMKIEKGNIAARMRMIYLYHLAHFHNGIVLSTDNYTEYLLGFWTLHGDVGDFGIIQSLWKTEVYEIARAAMDRYNKDSMIHKSIEKSEALLQCIRAIPTDGLGVTLSDFEQLGVGSYDLIDYILQSYLQTRGRISGEHVPPIYRYENTHYKRNNPYNIKRHRIVDEVDQ